MKHIFSSILIILICLFSIFSCSGAANKSEKEDQNLDIPEYTKPGVCYFGSSGKTVGYRGKVGNILTPHQRQSYSSALGHVFAVGVEFEVDSEANEVEQFYIYYASIAIRGMIEDSHRWSMHVRAEMPEGGGIGKTEEYYFYEDAQYGKAINYMSELQRTENMPSKFDGERTYHSKIGAIVKYYGFDTYEDKEFYAIYLECGAIVTYAKANGRPIRGDIDRKWIGKTIDCVVTGLDNNIDINAFSIE